MQHNKYFLIGAFLIWAIASVIIWIVDPAEHIEEFVGFVVGSMAILLLLLVVLTFCILIYETWQKRKEITRKKVILMVGLLGLGAIGIYGDIEILLFGYDITPIYFVTIMFLHRFELKRDKQPEALSPAS